MSGSDLSVGHILARCRRARGFSARGLSLKAGLSESVCGKIEMGDREPSMRAFALLAIALNLNDHEIATLVRLAGAQGDT